MAQSWQTVQAEVMRRITERLWLPGSLIPGEAELANELGCARVTVNRALRELAEKGILDRKRKAGTHVVKNPQRRATFAIPVMRIQVEGRGARYDHHLLERKTSQAPAHILSRMKLAADNQPLYLRALHFADGRPFAFEERWVNLHVVPEIADADLDTMSANEWLVNNAPFTRGDLSLGACKANQELAELLQCETGDALLEMERSTSGKEGSITAVRLIHVPGYRLLTEL